MLTDAESQHLSCSLKLWCHQLTYTTAEPVEEVSAGAPRLLPHSQCALVKVKRSPLGGHPAHGALPAHRAFLCEGLLHTGVTWLPQGLGGLWHCCHWYLQQLRENLDCSCYSHTSCAHCGGTEMEQLLLPCPSQAPALHHSLLFSNCWETGTADPANYHHFKEQSYVWKAILFPIQKQKEMRIS